MVLQIAAHMLWLQSLQGIEVLQRVWSLLKMSRLGMCSVILHCSACQQVVHPLAPQYFGVVTACIGEVYTAQKSQDL